MAERRAELQEQALEVHRRLLLDEPTAPLDATELLLGPLTGRLCAQWSKLDRDACHDAATEVLVQYLQAPARYDPTRASLMSWLFLQAHRDLINDYESKQKSFERAWLVESDLLPDRITGESAQLDEHLPPTEMTPRPAPSRIITAIRNALPDEMDRRLLWAIADEGSRSTDEAANILGLMHLPPAERAAEVRKNKDRIMKRLRRLDWGTGDD